MSCDEKPAAVADAAPEAAATTTVTASTPPAPPKPPVVTVDDASIVVTGDKIDFSGGDTKGRITAMLVNKTLVSGQTLEVDALRDTTMAHFAIAADALRDAHVKGATIKTALRDRTMGSIDVLFEHSVPAACAAVGMVAKDNSIDVWSYGGGANRRFTKGFAGPDMTRGSDGLRTIAAACDSTLYFVAADDSIKWGVVFDLALAAKSGDFKPTSVVVVTKTPVPGKKVTE